MTYTKRLADKYLEVRKALDEKTKKDREKREAENFKKQRVHRIAPLQPPTPAPPPPVTPSPNPFRSQQDLLAGAIPANQPDFNPFRPSGRVTAGFNPALLEEVKYRQDVEQGRRYPRIVEALSGGASMFQSPEAYRTQVEAERTAESNRRADLSLDANPLIRFANTPTALFGLTPAEIVGIGTIAAGGYQAGKALYDRFLAFRRLPQYRAIEDFAKAEQAAGRPVNQEAKQSLQNVVKSAFNLYKQGMTEAADEIMARFNQAYSKAYPAAQGAAGETRLTLGTRPIPAGTQTGAMAFGGRPAGGTGKNIPKPEPEVSNAIQRVYDAVLSDIRSGQQVPVPTALRTTYIQSPEHIRKVGDTIQITEGGKWVAVGSDVLNYWAKVKKLESPLDARIRVSQSPPATQKEPWQMTREEYIVANPNLVRQAKGRWGTSHFELNTRTGDYQKIGQVTADTPERVLELSHEKQIQQALSEGKPVPAAVLKDYPDLSPPVTKGGESKPATTQPQMAPSTSVQTGLPGLGRETAQTKMFEESNVAAGQGGKKQTLIDVDAEKARAAAKPLPGQIGLPVPAPQRITAQQGDVVSEQEYYEAESRLEIMKQTLADDRVANFQVEVPTTRIRNGKETNVTQRIPLTSPIFENRKEGGFGTDGFSKRQAELLAKEGGIDFNTLIPDKNGRYPATGVLDGLVQQFHNEGWIAEPTADALIEKINQIHQQRADLVSMKERLDNLQVEAPVKPAEQPQNQESAPPKKPPAPPSAPPVAPEQVSSTGEAVSLKDDLKAMIEELATKITDYRTILKGLKREGAADARRAMKLLEAEAKNAQKIMDGITPNDIKKTRSAIMAFIKYKGISETQAHKIFKEVSGETSLREMTDAELQAVLKRIKEARPVRIKGRIVLKEQTEKAIQKLKANLIGEGKLTEQAYAKIMRNLKLPIDRYYSPRAFITEQEAHALLRQMNYEAEVGLVKRQGDIDKALAANPQWQPPIDKINDNSTAEADLYLDKLVKVSPAWDAWLYTEKLQNRTGQPFYEVYRLMLDKSRQNDYKLLEVLHQNRTVTPDYNKIRADEKAAERIRAYLADKAGQSAQVQQMSEGELAIARDMEANFALHAQDVPFWRFYEAYRNNDGDLERMANDIPQSLTDKSVKADLKEAIKIYESQGATAVRAFLKGKPWGIVNSGYEPHSFISPKVAASRMRTAVSKGMLRSRELPSPEKLEKMDIFEAWERYNRHMLNLELEPYFRKMEQLLKEAAPKLRDFNATQRDINLIANGMKHVNVISHPLSKAVAKVGGYASSVVFAQPHLGVRNLYQPIQLNPYRLELINPANKPLTPEEHQYFDIYGQGGSQLLESVMQLEMGEGNVARFLRRVSTMGVSETWNNRWVYWAAVNKGNRALAAFRNDGNIKAFIKRSGMGDLSARQQKEALELMALGQEDEAVRFTARKINQNTNLIYDPRERGIISMGEVGTLLGSLGNYSRGFTQRVFEQIQKIKNGTWSETRHAAEVLAGIIVAGAIGDWIWQRVTGRNDKPYNPLSAIGWTPGGLMVGATQDTADIIQDVFKAVTGDEDALMRLPKNGERGFNLLLPYYGPLMNALEALTNTKNADRLALRKVIAYFKKNYHPNEDAYHQERNWIQALQHALFGGDVKPSDKETAFGSQSSQSWDDLKRKYQTPRSGGQSPSNSWDDLKRKYGR